MSSNMKIKVIKSLNCSIHVARLIRVKVDNKSYLFLHCEYYFKDKLLWFVSSRLKSIRINSDNILIKTLNCHYRIAAKTIIIHKLSVNEFMQLKYS